jgi:DNA repair protein RadC
METTEAPEKPHYIGHRDRLRQRFLTQGSETLADYELLEMLLFGANARKDMKPLAKTLIARFGSFRDVLMATPEALAKVEGMTDTAIATLALVPAAAARMLKQEITEKPMLSSWHAVLDYCQITMGYALNEQFRILFLNHKNRLITDEVQGQGSINHATVYVRDVVKRALELGASSMILVHNHPSGDPTPSADDITLTKQIIAAALPLGVRVFDHVIVGKSAHYSFKAHGLM